MRIISSFKDYYDCIQAYGQDDLNYIRHPIETKEVSLGLCTQSTYLPKWHWNNVRILFCGKLYSGYRFVQGLNSTKFMYTPEEVKDFCNTHDITYKSKYRWVKNDFAHHYEQLEKDNVNNLYLPICEKYLSPIVVVASSVYESVNKKKQLDCMS